jgi:hypothetical protein
LNARVYTAILSQRWKLEKCPGSRRAMYSRVRKWMSVTCIGATDLGKEKISDTTERDILDLADGRT